MEVLTKHVKSRQEGTVEIEQCNQGLDWAASLRRKNKGTVTPVKLFQPGYVGKGNEPERKK